MTIKNADTIKALQAFLQGSQAVVFSVLSDKTERYDFIRKMRVKIGYMGLSKRDKGIVITPICQTGWAGHNHMERMVFPVIFWSHKRGIYAMVVLVV